MAPPRYHCIAVQARQFRMAACGRRRRRRRRCRRPSALGSPHDLASGTPPTPQKAKKMERRKRQEVEAKAEELGLEAPPRKQQRVRLT